MLFRRTTFADVPIFEAKNGRKPAKVALIVPHTNEQPAVLPFRDKLGRRLQSEGIETEHIVTGDIMETGWKIRKLFGDEIPDTMEGPNQTVGLVLSLRDMLNRLRVLRTSVAEGTLMVELHSYQKLGRYDSISFDPVKYQRINQTGILVVPNLVLTCLNDSNDFLSEAAVFLLSTPFAKKLERLLGFDLKEAIKEIRDHLGMLQTSADRIMLVELPSFGFPLSSNHEMFPFYYTGEWGQRYGEYHPSPRKRIVSFHEDVYCSCYRGVGEFSDREVNAVSSILVLPSSLQ
ncbi:MAG: hypothetical protein ABID61_01065 [Candidatus Micrarchaeota archaeon]